jgi:hypothetical protein
MDDVHASATDHLRHGLAETGGETRVVESAVQDPTVGAAPAVGNRHHLAREDTFTRRGSSEQHRLDALELEVLREMIDRALESAGGVERVSGSGEKRHPHEAILRRMLSICSQWRAHE